MVEGGKGGELSRSRLINPGHIPSLIPGLWLGLGSVVVVPVRRGFVRDSRRDT